MSASDNTDRYDGARGGEEGGNGGGEIGEGGDGGEGGVGGNGGRDGTVDSKMVSSLSRRKEGLAPVCLRVTYSPFAPRHADTIGVVVVCAGRSNGVRHLVDVCEVVSPA